MDFWLDLFECQDLINFEDIWNLYEYIIKKFNYENLIDDKNTVY